MDSSHFRHSPPLVCGHRGAAAVVAENTIASFEEAVRRGARWVEFDVRPTSDSQIVIHHDPATALGHHVGSSTRGALDDSIPTLSELGAALTDVGLDIEMKTDDIERDLAGFVDLVLAEIDRLPGSRDRPMMVTSFDADAIALVRSARPELATGLLFHDKPFDWAIDTAVAAGHHAVAPWHRLVDAEAVAAAHEAGLAVFTWTVNDAAEVRRVAAAGVDMIIGDDPAVIVANLGAR